MDTGLPPRLGRPPLKRATARNYFLLNLLGAPGLGTFLAGERFLGVFQFLLSMAGLLICVVWVGRMVWCSWQWFEQGGEPASQILWPYAVVGLVLFIAGWIWGIVTGRRLIREALDEIVQPPGTSPIR